MSVTVVEYSGYASGRPFAVGIPIEPPIAVTQFSSAAASTGFLALGTRFVSVYNSFGSSAPSAWVLFTTSSGSTTVATSTSGVPIPIFGIMHYAPVCISTAAAGGLSTTSGVRYTVLSS